jgi:MOSC domain-containing protein YiiM
MAHLGAEELATGLEAIRRAPAAVGTLEMIVRRPTVDEREVVDEGVLTLDDGLVGDHWRARGSRSTADGAADPDRQLTLMGSRLVDLLAGGDRRGWPMAGDQLYVDLDLSVGNLPAGTRLAVGGAVIEVTEPPHTGCAKFSARFGSEALRFVNSPEGRELRLRGLNARVVLPGTVRRGDAVRRLPASRPGPAIPADRR